MEGDVVKESRIDEAHGEVRHAGQLGWRVRGARVVGGVGGVWIGPNWRGLERFEGVKRCLEGLEWRG